MIRRLAFFDDFAHPVMGHHPELILGLAEAGAAITRESSVATTIYCPEAFLAHRAHLDGVAHKALSGRWPFDLEQSVRNVTRACQEAGDTESVIYNCFFDENYPAWTNASGGRLVHHLHRPGELPAGAVMTGQWRSALAADLQPVYLVNTSIGIRQASRFLPGDRLLRVGWPAASRQAVASRFSAPPANGSREPYVLLIGGAREDKGVDLLWEALEDGPLLRVTGQQLPGDRARLTWRYPRTRVAWQTGFVSRAELAHAIADAAVVVFPYLPVFAEHGGASAALAQALTFGKPVLISDVLADQVPSSPACQVQGSSDPAAWRLAIKRAIRDSVYLHLAARELQIYVEHVHTYEGCLERVLERLAGE